MAGGEGFNVAGFSMGKTFVASSRGMEAIGTNPANLALTDENVTFTLIPPLSFGFRSDFLDYEIYSEYFTGIEDTTGDGERESRYLTAADKERILSIFPAGVAETYLAFDFRLLALTVHNDFLGSIGLSVTEKVAFHFDLPRDYARIFLEGLDSLGSRYDFSGTAIRGWWIREYSFSYARKLPDLVFAKRVAAGFSVKLVHGFGYTGTDHYNASFGNEVLRDPSGNIIGYRIVGNSDFRQRRSGIDIDPDEYSPFKPAGSGLGFDVGVSAEFIAGVKGALSVTDIGSITWRQNTKEFVGIGGFEMTNVTSQEQQDSLERAFKGKEQDVGEFSTPLATSLRLGGSLQLDETPWVPWLPGRMLISLEFQQGFNNSPGNTTRPRVGIGVEYRPIGILPLRTGISIGGLDRFNWAMGFGLDFVYFTLDIGTGNIGALFTNSFQQFSLGLGMRFKV